MPSLRAAGLPIDNRFATWDPQKEKAAPVARRTPAFAVIRRAVALTAAKGGSTSITRLPRSSRGRVALAPVHQEALYRVRSLAMHCGRHGREATVHFTYRRRRGRFLPDGGAAAFAGLGPNRTVLRRPAQVAAGGSSIRPSAVSRSGSSTSAFGSDRVDRVGPCPWHLLHPGRYPSTRRQPPRRLLDWRRRPSRWPRSTFGPALAISFSTLDWLRVISRRAACLRSGWR